MKKYFVLKIGLVISIMLLYTQIAFSQTTHTVNYTITSWDNASGSFTFQTGTTENPVTKQIEGFFKIILENGEVIVINPQLIESVINSFENSTVNEFNNSKRVSYKKQQQDAKDKLLQLKLLLQDQNRMNEFIAKLENNTDLSGLNWSYDVQTIRGIQALITGTVD